MGLLEVPLLRKCNLEVRVDTRQEREVVIEVWEVEEFVVKRNNMVKVSR